MFPDSPRVIYAKNTLAEVICQLRFHPIFRIESEPPASFQDRIRSDYPQAHFGQALEFPADVPVELANFVASQAPGLPRTYDFLSIDENWKTALTREFLALSTRKYIRWEEFRARLEKPLSALCDVYQPSQFTRIGLRYRNIVRRSEVGLGDADWAELIRREILAELAIPELAGRMRQFSHEYLLTLDDGSQMKVRHGLARERGRAEAVYLIDADYYAERTTEPGDATTILDEFNKLSGRFFRWCITDKLHNALQPARLAEPVDG
jgi:uncharacterized protein (TIGR04255 family)